MFCEYSYGREGFGNFVVMVASAAVRMQFTNCSCECAVVMLVLIWELNANRCSSVQGMNLGFVVFLTYSALRLIRMCIRSGKWSVSMPACMSLYTLRMEFLHLLWVKK